MSDDSDRFLGALIGLAVGDALGAPLEFMPRDAAPAVTGMRGGGKFELQPGQWTDDTSMALCIASSLIETGTFDLRDQLVRYLRWRDEGYLTSTGRCFGIGQQTFWALGDFAKSAVVTRDVSKRWRSGNGCLMRLAPVPMVFAHDLDLAGSVSGVSSLTTHPTIDCQEACATYGRLIACALRGWKKDEILAEGQRLAQEISTKHYARCSRVPTSVSHATKFPRRGMFLTPWKPHCGHFTKRAISSQEHWRLSIWETTPIPSAQYMDNLLEPTSDYQGSPAPG